MGDGGNEERSQHCKNGPLIVVTRIEAAGAIHIEAAGATHIDAACAIHIDGTGAVR